jgi:uncharacterized protein (TIGR02453 family)
MGLNADTLKFLKDLRRHNDREWFQANRARYDAALADYTELVRAVILAVARFDASVARLRPPDAIFRIFRDVRFARDKSPYKTHFGASLSAGGRKTEGALYYLHVEPGDKSFCAAGLYMPAGPTLNRVRAAIAEDPAVLRKILSSAAFRKLYPGLEDIGRVKTAPRGVPRDHPALEILQNKSFIVSTPLTDAQLSDADASQVAGRNFKTAQPFVDYLRRISSG